MHGREDGFAAPVSRVETTTVVRTPDGEQILDRTVLEYDDGPPANGEERDSETFVQPHPNAVFTFRGVQFQVPGTARVLQRFASDGVLISAEFFDEQRVLISSLAVERDERGRFTRALQSSRAAPDVELRNVFHDDGSEESIVTLAGMPIRVVRQIRGPHGFVVREEEESLSFKRTVEYSYEINSRGDWIERIATGAGTATSIVRRAITYRDDVSLSEREEGCPSP